MATTNRCFGAIRGAQRGIRPATCSVSSGRVSCSSTSGAAPGRSHSTWPRGLLPEGCSGWIASRTSSTRPSGSARPARSRTPAFCVGDVYALEMPHASFDVVHAHQVLQHLRDPVAALSEMRRVLRPGGLLAVRDSDYGAKIWAPQDERLDRWMELYHQVTKANGAEADAGRYLPGWVREAGFADLEVSTTTWTFADLETCLWWGELWADRVQLSAFADQAIGYGLSDATELASIAEAWRRWAVDPGAMFVVLGVEVLARA